jgi:hypothetical protein
VFKSSAWLLAGAVFATAGAAHAQEALSPAAELNASRAAVPWYQRFTTSSGLTESITGVRENDRILPPAWTLTQRWGVTVDVTEAARIERGPEGRIRGEQAAVGAYYQFTPGARVGAEVRVEDPANARALTPGARDATGANADVRIESAFRF